MELNDFAEKYLEYGDAILNPDQKTRLHQLLAIGYRMTGDQLNSLSHLQQCDLKATRLKRARGIQTKGNPGAPRQAFGTRRSIASGNSILSTLNA